MYVSFRTGFFVAVVIGVYLVWLWRPERQLRLHNEHMLDALETKSWSRFAEFIDDSYHDQWTNDRPLLLARLQTILSYTRDLHIDQLGVAVLFTRDEAQCRARIIIQGQDDEVATVIKQKINTLETPFVFHWRHASAMPWDWKLTSVSNDELQLPESGFE